MWLGKEIQQICIKEFGLRHQLDIIQDNAYISFNLQQLVSLNILPEESVEGGWQQVAQKSNSYWFNIVEFLKKFPDLFNILDQKEFVNFTSITLTKSIYKSILSNRIESCKRLLEIFRTVVYRSFLRESLSRIKKNRLLFDILHSRSNLSDPPGQNILPLDNRIIFIRTWLEKLVIRNQTQYPVNIWYPIPIIPEETFAKTVLHSSSTTPNRKRKLVSIVSESKPSINFTKIKKKPIRISDIVFSQDSTSTSSSDSIWDSPFQKSKRL